MSKFYSFQKNNLHFFQVVLVAFVCLAIVLSTAGIYLRSWELEFRIQELKVEKIAGKLLVGWMVGYLGDWDGSKMVFVGCISEYLNTILNT